MIVTKNRSNCLVECLASLLAQTTLIAELVLVDNRSSDETPVIIENSKKNITFPVVTFSQRGNRAAARNYGLRAAKHDWVAFVDDDCVVDAKWLETVSSYIRIHQNTAVIIGGTKTYNKLNYYSQAFSLMEYLWKEIQTKNNTIFSYEIADTKNIVYNKKFLTTHHIQFDEEIKNENYCSEDMDVGLQIQKYQGEATYLPAAFVYHKDPKSFAEFYRKIVQYVQSKYLLSQKWPVLFPSNKPRDTFLSKLRYIRRFKKEIHVDTFFFSIVLIHFLAGNLLKKIIWYLHYKH